MCAHSLDGGLTWSPTGEPAFTGVDPAVTDPGLLGVPGACGGLHGHLATDNEGRLFLPKEHCGYPWIAVSSDGGLTWTRTRVSNQIKIAENDPQVAVDPAGNVYYTWWDDKHQLPYLSISRDHGKTWSTPLMIAPPGVHEVNFPTIAAGETGKIALTFPGTPVNNRDDATRPWNSYVVVSPDALSDDPTFYSNIANPANDPVYRGNCLGRCGRMFDFLYVLVSPFDGTVWATAVDTCTAKDGCNSAFGVTSTDMRGIAIKQFGGPLVGTAPCTTKRCR